MKQVGRKKGCITWNKGIKCPQISMALKNKPKSEEHKKSLSEARIGKIYIGSFKKGHTGGMTGRKHSLRTKLKMSKSASGTKRPWAVQNAVLGALALSQLKSTSIERKVYEELKNRGLLFEKQKLINGKFLVDVYIPSLNLIIECDGDYWHSLDRVIKRDKTKNAYLTKCGYNILHLTETEINKDTKIAIERIYS
jgi:very-short-patch-repair endonuclease